MPMGPIDSILSGRVPAQHPFFRRGLVGLALLALFAVPSTLPAFADDPATREREEAFSFGAPPEVVTIETAWSVDRSRAGESVLLAVVLDIEHGFHINANVTQQGDTGDFEPWATTLRVVDASDVLLLETPRYPKPIGVTAEYVEGELMAFEGRTIFYLPVRVAEDAPEGEVSVTVEVDYQTCDDQVCLIPVQEQLTATLTVASPGQPMNPVNEALFTGFEAASAGVEDAAAGVRFDVFGLEFSIDSSTGVGFALLLLVAALGGLLLNFTPCVLPVIPIKIIGLSKAADGNRGRVLILGLTMALGVIAFWVGLGLLISLASGFTATNQLFQYPVFTLGVGIIIAVMAVGMSGFFTINLPQAVYRVNPGQDTVPGSFGFGIMTAVLSTPCTAPFMGAAAAWAATQSPLTTLVTFGAIGIGMALPYFVLSVSPDLVKKMPKSGPASELLKQVMGLLMLAAAAYFIGVGLSAVFNRAPDPPSKVYWWGVMGMSALAGIWLAVRTLKIARGPGARGLFATLGLLVAGLSVLGAVRLTDPGPIDWVYYTPERFQEALDRGEVVVMDFTAEWCLNCKGLEHSVLNDARVSGLFGEEDVTPIKVDITGNNPVGKARLKEAGRLTIPLLVVYAADGTEVFKSDFYTVDQVVGAVAEARRRP